MSNTVLLTLGRELDVNGVTVPGAKAYFYEAGTTTPITVYTDTAASIAHPSPVEADAGGLFPACYVTASTAKVVITKADDSALRTIDPCPILSVSGVGASGVSFTPTVDIPATNVQDAIVLAAATAAAGFAAFGLGITGNAPTLANIDATNIGEGQYRTTGATTGTFPTGITAASTSIVRVERETAALAYMLLLDDTQGRSWTRWMVASVWGAWKENITMPMASATGAIPVMGATGPTSVAPGTGGQALLGVTSGVPVFSDRRIYSSPYTTTGGATADSTGLFPGGANIPPWATTVGIELLGVATAGAPSSPTGVRIGDGTSFLSANYVSHASRDAASDYIPTNIFGHFPETAGVSMWGFFRLNRLGTGDWTIFGSNALPGIDAVSVTNGYILSANLGGKIIDRVRFMTSGTTFSVMRIVFWYE